MKLSLRALRVNANLRLIDAADKLNISRFTLRNYELGRREPNLSTFLRMCELYDFWDVRMLEYEMKSDGRANNNVRN